jgi:hypothetical protein
MTSSDHKPKSVYVRHYSRVRFNRIENVCQHYHSHPNQLDLFH